MTPEPRPLPLSILTTEGPAADAACIVACSSAVAEGAVGWVGAGAAGIVLLGGAGATTAVAMTASTSTPASTTAPRKNVLVLPWFISPHSFKLWRLRCGARNAQGALLARAGPADQHNWPRWAA